MRTTIQLSLFLCVFCFNSNAVAQDVVDKAPTVQETEPAPVEAQEAETTPDTPQESDTRNDPGAKNEQVEERQPPGPKYEKYINTMREGRTIKAEIDRMYGTMPVGFPKLRDQHRQKLAQLKARQQELKGQIADLAIEAFKESPMSDRTVAKIVFNHIVASMKPRTVDEKFNPATALELADLMTSNGLENKDIYFLAFRAAFALQEFDRAEMLLQNITENGTKLPPQVLDRYKKTKEAWNRELEIRAKESTADDLPKVQFETTAGNFVIELFEDQAPQTVANFISLVEKGFYDGLIFHIVKPGTLIQSGCPQGNGKGDPGYRIPCECYKDEVRNHFTGTISMSNSGRDTGGSQFFITHQPIPSLDGKFTVFGRIIDNLDVIYDVKTVDRSIVVPTGALDPTVINRISVVRKRDHIYEPTIVETAETEPESSDADLLSQPDEGGDGN